MRKRNVKSVWRTTSYLIKNSKYLSNNIKKLLTNDFVACIISDISKKEDVTMKKTEAIRKINTMGKVGNILAMITRILVIVLLVLSVAGFVIVLFLPADLCRVKMDGRAQVLVDLSAFGWETDEALEEEVRENVKSSANISYAGNHFAVDEVTMDGSRMEVDASARLTEFNIKSLAWALAGAIVVLILLLISVIFVGRLAKAFRDCSSPFEGLVIRRMKQFAYALIPWAVISSVVGSLEQCIWMASGGFSFDLDFGIIIIVLVILALAYIFQYGAVLQQESDETL